MKKMILAFVLPVLLVGCISSSGNVQPVRAPMPTIEETPIPKLTVGTPEQIEEFNKLSPQAKRWLLENDAALKLTIMQQKAAIDTYNKFAKEQNDLNANVLGLKVGEKPKEEKK